ncbi:hypothetical protein FRX31_019860 [Thalictrum thalictroides]|uniref:Uncharacterized protein n=1 Tax=Thalictrum thalictroides TaxID=46969 RepID=A0A7J6W0E2_THATH|nr:hypothetical protein FRX31_019860 [Thalictrum thalictroides]
MAEGHAILYGLKLANDLNIQLRKLKNQNNSLRRKLKRPRTEHLDDAISSTPSRPKTHLSIWDRLSGPGINFRPFTIPETSENNLDSGYQEDDEFSEKDHEGCSNLGLRGTHLPKHGCIHLANAAAPNGLIPQKKTRFNGRHMHPTVHNVSTDQARYLASNAADAVIKAKVLEAQAAAMRAQAAALADAEAAALQRNSTMRKNAHAASQALTAATEAGATSEAAVNTQSVEVVDIPSSFQDSEYDFYNHNYSDQEFNMEAQQTSRRNKLQSQRYKAPSRNKKTLETRTRRNYVEGSDKMKSSLGRQSQERFHRGRQLRTEPMRRKDDLAFSLTEAKLKDMISTALRKKDSRDHHLNNITSLTGSNSPFSIRIQAAQHSTDFKTPALSEYDDIEGDPWSHVNEFKIKMILVGHDDAPFV